MTHSLTPQVVHCPLSHPPPRPLPPLPPPPPSSSSSSITTTTTTDTLPAEILGCRRCFSAQSSSPHHHNHPHHPHHPHHHHRVHQHRRHLSPSLTQSPSRRRHHLHRHHPSFSDVIGRADKTRAEWSADRTKCGPLKCGPLKCGPLKDCHDCSRGRQELRDCASDRNTTRRLAAPSTAVAVVVAAAVTAAVAAVVAAGVPFSASETWRWCRTLLTLPVLLLLLLVLLLLLLLPHHRRKSRKFQVVQVPRLLLTLCLLTMLTGRCLASPWIEEDASSVKLRAKICQPVPEEHLRSMLGPAYDPSRMSSQDPRDSSKRSDPNSAPEMDEAAFDSFYMKDDPGAGEYESEDFVDIVTDDGEEQDWYRREEEVEEDEEEDGLEVQEKDFEEEEARFYQKKRVGRVDSSQSDQLKSRSRDRQPQRDQRYLYMKRRRRATGAERDRPGSAGSDSGLNKDKKNKDSLLPLRLLLSGRNRKLRRKLKKVFRKKAKKLSKKPPPWNCNMTKVWGRLKEGYFPRYLLDGRCATDKCFYRLYDCVPQKYRVKVLKRDPDYCNPLPALGANSTYEQKWSVVRYYVTVGCNCQAADPLQRSRSGRRRNS